MALLKNAGLSGSAAGGLLLAMLFFRGSAPIKIPIEAKNAQARTSAEKFLASKSLRSSAKKWPADGPWKASRRYFAGRQAGQSQSQKSDSQKAPGVPQMDGSCPSLQADSGKKAVAVQGDVTLTLEQSGDGTAIDKGQEHSRLWCIPTGARVAAMIATVSDPVHSHLALFFDRTVEALQLAGESMGYEMDRYWLPWQPQTPGNAPSKDDAEDRSEKEKQPGLMMFRWNGAANVADTTPRVLYVFLVSDTSTAGIEGTQFSNAVQYVQQVCKAPDGSSSCPAGNDVKIIGPTFSGSLASLRSLTAARPDLKFSAYSGTISSICAVQDQGIFSQPPLKSRFSRPCFPTPTPTPATSPTATLTPTPIPTPTPNLTFRSMVGDSATAVLEFIDDLRSKRAIQCNKDAPPQVAILSEAATTYGNTTGQVREESTENECSYTDFRYPREISSLRNASASSDPPVVASQQASDGPAYLPFTLADQQPNSGDEPPDFSQTQGPLSKEAVLMKYAADLRRGRYRDVGIVGTNVLDVLFLAKFLNSACPDVRLFIINNPDLLFERDLDNAPYIGMLSVSTYPLIGRTMDWASPGSKSPPLPRLPFSDQYEEGHYNASVLAMREALSSKAGTLMEMGRPFMESVEDFKPDSSILPLWLTVAGTGGYWPVQIMQQASAPTNADTSLSLQDQDFSSAWWVVTLVLTILGLLQSWVFLTVKPDAMRFRDFSMTNAAPAQRFFFINVVCVSLAFTLALFIVPAGKYGRQAGSYVCGISLAGLCAICCLFGACCYLSSVFPKPGNSGADSTENRDRWLSIIASVLIWVLALTGILFWRSMTEDDSSHYGFFFSYRSVNLATGVSPLAPILVLLLALYLWGVFEIWRLRFDRQVRPRLNLPSLYPGGDQEEKIANSINQFLLNKNYCMAFGIVYGAWLISLHPCHPFNLIERSSFGWFYEIIFCLVVVLMLTSGMRLSQTWGHLHKFLLELERSKIRPAFNRLKGASWSSIWNSGGQEEEWTSLARSFEVMEAISYEDKGGTPALNENIRAAIGIRTDIHKLHCEEPKNYPELENKFNGLQNSLAVVLKDVMAILHASKHTGLVEKDEFDQEDKPVVVNCCEEKPDEELKRLQHMQEYAALRYVAFIRSTVGHIRRWLILQAAVFSLVLLSLNVYSFDPHRSLIWAFSAIYVLIGLAAMGFLTQIERNHVISRITGTKPNELGRSFYFRMVTLGAVPLLTLLATHFPAIGHYLASFLQPGMEAIK